MNQPASRPSSDPFHPHLAEPPAESGPLRPHRRSASDVFRRYTQRILVWGVLTALSIATAVGGWAWARMFKIVDDYQDRIAKLERANAVYEIKLEVMTKSLDTIATDVKIILQKVK